LTSQVFALNKKTMKIEILQQPNQELVDFFDKKIEEFNLARWEIKQKIPLAVRVTNETGEIVGGAAGKTFGLWLLLDNLWISENLRGQDLGSKVLKNMENAAIERGCKFVLLDTLDFQARPFYEKQGYKCQWVQLHYPRDGQKHFMIKDLSR
jgi:GNAT superfamily N-acetyltransferase